MIYIDRTASRDVQLKQQTERCYDDYCFYNRIEGQERVGFVQFRIDAIGTDDFVLPYLPIYLTTVCSLNCEKCNNLMPMFHGHASDFSWDKTRQSLDIILSRVVEIIFCELVGGEPFLNKDMGDALDYLGSMENVRQIVIVTNGTVIPSEQILEKLKKYNVLVRVSDYGLFEKMAGFVAKLDEYGINVRIQQDMKWNDPGGIKKRNRGREELKRQYNFCEFSLKCKYLCEDMLFSCARAASLYHLGLFDSNKDIMSISEGLSASDIKKFYLQDEGDICDYCDLCTVDGKLIPAAVQAGDKQIRHSDYTVISNYELNHYKKMTREYEKKMAQIE